MNGTHLGIVVDGVSRSFGAVKAVKDVSFEAQPGTVTGLIGPNGSGKTTLMLMLASLLKPDGGTIQIAGSNPVDDPQAARAKLGWMPDVLGSWASLSVRTTLEITSRLYRTGRDEAAARADELIDLVNLAPLADSPTRVLSRGQKQRLSLARALVHDPQVLLLDEPASGLDPASRVDLRILVRRLADEGKTILVSSHVLAELDEMADGAVYMENGVTATPERVAGTRTTTREWRIRSRDMRELLVALDLAGVSPTTVVPDRSEVTVALAGEAEATELLTRLVTSGIAISTYAPSVGDIEHTYLSLSGEAE